MIWVLGEKQVTPNQSTPSLFGYRPYQQGSSSFDSSERMVRVKPRVGRGSSPQRAPNYGY